MIIGCYKVAIGISNTISLQSLIDLQWKLTEVDKNELPPSFGINRPKEILTTPKPSTVYNKLASPPSQMQIELDQLQAMFPKIPRSEIEFLYRTNSQDADKVTEILLTESEKMEKANKESIKNTTASTQEVKAEEIVNTSLGNFTVIDNIFALDSQEDQELKELEGEFEKILGNSVTISQVQDL
jgi:hypothetical protein